MTTFDGHSAEPTFIGSIYRGDAITPMGSVIDLIWALVDAIIGGAILYWLYNRLVSRK
jgi:hypothetical protein